RRTAWLIPRCRFPTLGSSAVRFAMPRFSGRWPKGSYVASRIHILQMDMTPVWLS
ncbi:hypothetical protein L9F63_026445, partial [Diploptera punctata]